MPNGKLTTLVASSSTEEYPKGCAGTAWRKLMQEIGKFSTDDERRLKEMFESEQELGSKKNPAKYIDKLIQVRNELDDKYGYVETDIDVIDQVIKVVGKKYDHVVDQIMKDRRNGTAMSLSAVRTGFNEKHLLIK